MDITRHINFNKWANQRLAEQITPLSNDLLEKEFGGSFPSIKLTLLHLLQADYRWMNRLKGIPIVDIPTEWQSFNTHSILATWLPIQDQLVSLAGVMKEDQDIKFTTAKGDTHVMPLREVVIHVVNHGTYHRGQLVNMLRMAGANPPGTDYFIYSVSHE